MIGNGFIRDQDGDWFSMVGIDRIVVTAMVKEYGDMGNYWEIQAIWKVDGEDCSIIIDKHFESAEEAQLHLDSMMKEKVYV